MKSATRYNAFLLGLFAVTASGAGFLISGILPYNGGSAALCIFCLTAAAISLGLVMDPPANHGKQLKERRQQGKVPPAAQVQALSEQYGLPVVTPLLKDEALPVCTAPPVSAGGPGPEYLTGRLPASVMHKPHVCNDKYYEMAIWCPVHGDGTIRAIAGNVPGVIGGSMSSDEFARQVAKAAEESYVPEGSAELHSNLVETLRDQAAGAVKGSHWEMNAEWAAEVKKLTVTDGNGNRGPLWKARTRVMPAGYPSAYLLGFPVRVSEAYGAPSLEGP